MAFDIYAASVPVYANMLRNMRNWLDKAAAEGDAAALMEARLAPDMKPLAAQYQFATDTSRFAIGRLTGLDAPSFADDESDFAQLQARIDRTVAWIEGVDPAAFADAETRSVELRFPNGAGYGFQGAGYLTGFALPNFFFHVTTAYAILRHSGIALGKPDFLAHLGAPNLAPA